MSSFQKPFAERFPQAVYWLDLGLRPKAAKALVQAGYLSLADFAGKFRDEVLAISGLGKGSLRKLEEHLGSPLPSLKAGLRSFGGDRRSRKRVLRKPAAVRLPGAAYWRDLGLPSKAAKELARAGFGSLDDLRGKSREEMLAIPGMGQAALALCEQRLGFRFASPVQELLDHGIPLQVVHGLARAGFDSFEKVSRLTREQYRAQPGLGDKGMRQLEAVLGRRLDSPVGELCAQGLPRATAYRLSSAGVRQVGELASRPDSALRFLGLTSGDIEECHRLLRKAEEGGR